MTVALGGLGTAGLPWGQEHHATFARRFDHLAFIGVMGEALPEERNEVTLDPVLTDSHGIPAPLIRYQLSENSKAMLAHGMARATEVFEAAVAIATYPYDQAQKVGWHLLGTCRMGDDPARSVAARWGRAHDVPNLFIVDGSLFVTSAVGNPTTTIQALALRTADYIQRERANLG